MQTNRWWELNALRELLGEQDRAVKPLGYDYGPDPQRPEYAFLAADVEGARRSIVLLHPHTLITCEVGQTSEPRLRIKQLQAAAPPKNSVSSADFAGVRLAGWVVLFHADVRSARSAVSFVLEGDDKLKFLVTGLAPGTWEIWRNGWLENQQAFVAPRAGALYFEGLAGSYFLRRPA